MCDCAYRISRALGLAAFHRDPSPPLHSPALPSLHPTACPVPRVLSSLVAKTNESRAALGFKELSSRFPRTVRPARPAPPRPADDTWYRNVITICDWLSSCTTYYSIC